MTRVRVGLELRGEGMHRLPVAPQSSGVAARTCRRPGLIHQRGPGCEQDKAA